MKSLSKTKVFEAVLNSEQCNNRQMGKRIGLCRSDNADPHQMCVGFPGPF